MGSTIFALEILSMMMLILVDRAHLGHLTPKIMTHGVSGSMLESSSHVTERPLPFALKKCCGEKEFWDEVTKKCIPHGNTIHANSVESNDQFWWLDVDVRFSPNGSKKKLRSILPITTIYFKSLPCHPYFTFMRWPGKVYLYSNGSMNISAQKSQSQVQKESILLTKEEYCVDQTLIKNTFHTLFLACPCKHVACVPMCCENHKILSINKYLAMDDELHCIKTSKKKVWNISIKPVEERDHIAGVSYTLLPNHPTLCDEYHEPIKIDMNDNKNKAKLLSNGSLIASKAGSPFYGPQYCVDLFSHCGQSRFSAIICVEKPYKIYMSAKNALYVALYGVGLLGLLGVLAVYALLPELRRPLNAKVLMNHAAALTAALVLLLVGHCFPQIDHYAYCASLAFLGQFFLLAAFYWLTILCFDIARGFRVVKPISHFNSGSRRLVYYALSAWGAPAVIVAVTIAINFAPRLPCWVHRPKIGHQRRCWFTDTGSLLAYYYGPVASLHLANVIMFSYIMVRLRAIQNENASFQNSDARFIGGSLRKRRERLILYVKLFSLMGVTWLLEAVTVVSSSEIAEFVIDFVNVFRGVGLFVACCCKRDVFHLLRKRFKELQVWWPLTRAYSGKGDSTTSTDVATNTLQHTK